MKAYRNSNSMEDKTELMKYIFKAKHISVSHALRPNDSVWRAESVELFQSFIEQLKPKYINEFKLICREELVWKGGFFNDKTKYAEIIAGIEKVEEETKTSAHTKK